MVIKHDFKWLDFWLLLHHNSLLFPRTLVPTFCHEITAVLTLSCPLQLRRTVRPPVLWLAYGVILRGTLFPFRGDHVAAGVAFTPPPSFDKCRVWWSPYSREDRRPPIVFWESLCAWTDLTTTTPTPRGRIFGNFHVEDSWEVRRPPTFVLPSGPIKSKKLGAL